MKSKCSTAALLVAMALGSSTIFINSTEGTTTSILVALGFPGYFASAILTNMHDPALWLAALLNAVMYFYLSRLICARIARRDE